MMLQIEFDHSCFIAIIKTGCESLVAKRRKESHLYRILSCLLEVLSIIIYIPSILNLTWSCCQSISLQLSFCVPTVIVCSHHFPFFSEEPVPFCVTVNFWACSEITVNHTDLFRLIKKLLETSLEVGHFKAVTTPVSTWLKGCKAGTTRWKLSNQSKS